jgi:hypothetical protein
MNRLALILAIIVTAVPAFAGPEANEGYCIGVAPEDCPHAWTQNNGRWTYRGVPQSEEGARREGRDVARWRPERKAGAILKLKRTCVAFFLGSAPNPWAGCQPVFCMQHFAMVEAKTPADLKLLLAIREALVTLEAARASAPSIVAAKLLIDAIRDLRALSISLEAAMPCAASPAAQAQLADIVRDLNAFIISLDPALLPPLKR